MCKHAVAVVFLLLSAMGCQDGSTAQEVTPALAPATATAEPVVARHDGRFDPAGEIELGDHVTVSGSPYSFSDEDLSVWKERVPGIEEVAITSSADQTKQPALFLNPGRQDPMPLLVALHSWSAGYLQNIGIPYAEFAASNGWVFVHPDHRGKYQSPEATASDLAIQDVIDAVRYSQDRARVDASRIYLVGYSGSAMTALVLAARRPEPWAAVVSWVPIYDLVDWYEYNRDEHPERPYAREIAQSCGGEPTPGSEAFRECKRRSPSSYLSEAPGESPILLGVGIEDDIVPPDHALRAYNDLAAPGARLSEEHVELIAERHTLPPELSNGPTRELFAKAGAPTVFERSSGRVTVILFQGAHDAVYNPGLAWLSRQRRAR
jgi:dipeptidyl aminopeptidase/acylaminoacyl peptidase